MMGKLTVRGIESAKPKDKPYKLIDGDGLQLRVATDGTKTWLVRYIVEGSEHQYRLPKPYGIPSGEAYLSLQDARDEAAKIRSLARTGVDFVARLAQIRKDENDAKVRAVVELEAQRAEHEASSRIVSEMFNAWVKDGVRRKDENAELLRSFAKDILPVIGHIAVKDVSEHDLRGVLRKMVERGVNRAAVIARNNLTQMFAWAEKRQPWRRLLVDGDPMALIEIEKIVSPDYDLHNTRDRVLLNAEIRELDEAIEKMKVEYLDSKDKRVARQPLEGTTEHALWLMLSTMCRVGELSQAKWEDVDFDAKTWFIPKANVKGNVAALTVRLSPFTLDQFKRLHVLTGSTAWCFPSRDKSTHIDVKSISKQIGDRQAMFKKNKDGGTRTAMKNRRSDNSLVLMRGERGAWTPHDLRRTGATMMQRLGVPLEIIDRCQNHVMPGSKVRRHYLHHDYAVEMEAGWAKLGAALAEILSATAESRPLRPTAVERLAA